jgi:predicted NodU family carbamoyl transferase
MVDLLAAGRVVGLHQGRSESGPRALGNRSILGDPRRPQLQDFINFEVKGREWFRPLAPLVLALAMPPYLIRKEVEPPVPAPTGSGQRNPADG